MRRATLALTLVSWLALFSGSPASVAETTPAASATEPSLGLMGVALHTQSMDELVRFYTEGLGMTLIRTIDFGSAVEKILSFGDQQRGPLIMLYQTKTPQDDTLFQGLTRARYVLKTADIKALAARIEKAGYQPGEIRNNAVNQMAVAMVRDPDGNILEIVEYPM